YRSRLPGPAPDWDRQVRRALNCIHGYLFREKLTVSWMREECRINGHNFASRFRHYVGMSPKEYIDYHRIEAAKLLLAKEEFVNMRVAAISYELGFLTPSAFSRLFKRKTGLSPSRWRKDRGKAGKC
ncbi:MAG TPA: AraC family transcriptional regulator, partial [Bacteroidales bacterium]|nr:AraC family transcriptional regulator [Bacteroidales bacterium]